MAKELELFSFDFSLLNSPVEPLSCPNCGYPIERPISLLSKAGFSKSLLVFGCGTLLYLNCFKKTQLRSVLLDVGSALQYYGKSLLSLLNGTAQSSRTEEKVCPHQTNCTLTSQWLQCNTININDDSVDLSLALSSLNSIGSSTVAKFDYLLDQVQQIKDSIAESPTELHSLQSPNCSLMDRRLSEGEITLSSLEWDLGDLPLFQESPIDDDDFHHFGGKKQSFLYNVKYNGIVDPEVLSQIIFNKDFDFKEKIYDGSDLKKYLATLRHQLKHSSKNAYKSNLKSAAYRSNRDSAFFEE